MAALNYSKLSEITTLNLNTTAIENPEQIVAGVQTMSDSATGGWALFIVLICLYVYLMVISNDKNGDFRLDFLASNVFALGTCFALSGVGLVLGFTNSYREVSFFGTMFFIFVVGKYLNRTKNP
jgi:hypothetical protein